MICKKRLLHEVAALESSLSVLGQASRALLGPVDHVEFLHDEVPLAIEDAERALAALKDLAGTLDEAA